MCSAFNTANLALKDLFRSFALLITLIFTCRQAIYPRTGCKEVAMSFRRLQKPPGCRGGAPMPPPPPKNGRHIPIFPASGR